MFKNLTIFQTASALARHAGGAHQLAARNIANADTPGFKAMVAQDFSDAFRAPGASLRATRPSHFLRGESNLNTHAQRRASQASPNGNTVSLEQEMVTSANAQRDHDKALAIYRHALTMIRTSLGRS